MFTPVFSPYLRFYHSILDDGALLKFTYLNGSEVPPTSVQSHLARLSTALAKTIFEMTTDQPYKGSLSVDPILVRGVREGQSLALLDRGWIWNTKIVNENNLLNNIESLLSKKRYAHF